MPLQNKQSIQIFIQMVPIQIFIQMVPIELAVIMLLT